MSATQKLYINRLKELIQDFDRESDKLGKMIIKPELNLEILSNQERKVDFLFEKIKEFLKSSHLK